MQTSPLPTPVPAAPPVPLSPDITAADSRLRWASVAPLVCAAHCALTPLLAVVAPQLVPGETLEWVLLGATSGISALALRWGRARHGRWGPALAVAAGLLGWSLSLAGTFEPRVHEEVTTVIFALLVAGALVWNARLRCSKGRCGSSCTHGDPTPPASDPSPTSDG